MQGCTLKASDVKLRVWRKVPYSEIVKALSSGKDYVYFIEGISRQTAYSAAKRLSKRLGFTVEAHSAIYDGKKGYVFIRGTIEELEERVRGSSG